MFLPASFCSASQSIFLKILISFVNQLCHLSRREWKQKPVYPAFLQVMRQDSTGIYLLQPFPWPMFKVMGGGEERTVVKRCKPAAKLWSQQPGQLTRQQQPDGIAGIVYPRSEVAMGWHSIFLLDCFQLCFFSNGKSVQLPTLQEVQRQAFTLQTKIQLVGSTSCQATHIVIGWSKIWEKKSF